MWSFYVVLNFHPRWMATWNMNSPSHGTIESELFTEVELNVSSHISLQQLLYNVVGCQSDGKRKVQLFNTAELTLLSFNTILDVSQTVNCLSLIIGLWQR